MTDARHRTESAVAAIAHPNVALVKYWGKRPGEDNIPATPSLSITLDALTTRTTVREGRADVVRVNGKRAQDAKIIGWLERMRAAWDLPPLAVSSYNDFPTGAGLASSASGFAALVTAVDAAFDLGLDATARSVWARRGSASAARSIFGGFVALDAEAAWAATPVLTQDAWPLEVVVAITSDDAKAVPSTAGMERSARTSPFHDGWVRSAAEDFLTARQAVSRRDFDLLAEVAEHSCLKMHAVMLATRPPLWYWNEATFAALRVVRELRASGVPVFFSVDAGPQVKAVCAPGHSGLVAATLARLSGIRRILRSGLGGGARCETQLIGPR